MDGVFIFREEAAGQRMVEPEDENGMGKETQEGEEGVSSADGYCSGDDGMVAPSDVIVHGPGSVEDMLNVLEDIEKQLDSAANRSPQQTEGAHESTTRHLQRKYTESRKKVCPVCHKIQCTCPDSSNAAKASEKSATTSVKSEREPPQVQVSQNTKPQDYVKADGSPLDRPDDAPWPFTILFVGVDNGEKTDPDLNLKREFEKIEQAYRESKVYHGSSRVLIKRLLFSKWSEVLIEIRKEAPTMLQFGCHAQKGKGFELFRQIVDPQEMLDAIRSWNKSSREQSPPRPEIRIIVSNACDSEDHARVLSEVVDFAIGHRDPVADENAIDFSGIFFDCLFGCDSLMDSFNQAKSCSKGYRLFSPERDPRQFYLVHSRHLSATASDMRLSASGAATVSARERPQDVSEGAGSVATATSQYEIVAYLKRRGLGRIAERLSEELSLEEIDDMQYVKEERLEKLKWLEDAPRAKLLKLCREVTARLISADDSDLSADDTISQGASTPLAHSEGSYDGEGFESDGEGVLIAARNGGNCSEFQIHMQSFIKSWRWYLETDPAQETYVLDDPLWTRCMFLWIRFAHDATLDQRLRDKWLHATTNSPNQDRLLSILTECLSHAGTTHPRWSPAESCECRKEHAAGISFTDMVVRHALRRNETSKKDWRDNVVRGWFDNTDEPFSDFLIRANRFLSNPEHNINGMSIFEAVVETQSYVVFTKMSGLAVSLLFGYLEARKLDLASAAGAARGGRPLLHGFTSFVSSEGHVFSLSRTGMPSLHVIVQGLQCLLHLAHTCWEMMGPVKTAQAFLLLQKDHTVELDTQEALFLSKQKDVPWEDGSHYEGRVAEESRMKEVRKIYKNDVSHGVIRNYLEALRERWGHYIDSASGERRRVDCQAVSLLLVKGKSLHDVCDSGGSTRQEDLICPISQSIMQDPVKCSDGHTDERKYIEEHFELAIEKRSPEEERHIGRSRFGHDARDGDSTGSKEGGKTNADVPFYTAEKFLEKFLKEIRLACLTGPPASGKTVTMQQVVCTHAATSFDNIHKQPQKDLALLPVFMRAAELPKLLSDNDKRVKNMKDLVELFVSANIHEGTFDVGVKNLILKLLDYGKVLICIDGLDEAAQHQDLVERIIDGAVKENRNLHILLSTREHSYRHSRGCLRLGAFDVVNLQPLDKDRQRAMIEDRLSKDKVGKFQEQLEGVAGKNPELATSPFLLSLIIEVYKEEGVIPTKRVELYDKQVKAIVSRCIYQRRLACIERDDKKGSLQILEKDLAADADALEVSTDYLGTLAFVCQMRLAKRDFTLAASLRYEQELWQDMLHIEQQHFNALAKINPRLRGRQQELLTLLYHTPDLLTRARELMFGNPIVGLLTVVSDKVYRFSHLTLQEYLAARCTVSFFGHDAQELLKKLTTFTDSASPRPLNSLWNRMVLQFAACMLSEQVFEGFCQLVLASDDGTGSHCELVQDFLKERGASEKVEQMVCDRLQEIRDSERRISAYKPLTMPDWSKAKTAESAMAIKKPQSVVDYKSTSAADVWSRAKVALRQERSRAATAPAERRGEHDTAVMAAPAAIYKHTKALADDVGIHRLRSAIVENPEGFFERAAAENFDNVTIQEFTRACTESVTKKLASSLSLASTANAASAAALLTAEAAEGQLADLHKQNAVLKKELEKTTASQEDDIPMQTSTSNEMFTASSAPSDLPSSSPSDSDALFAVFLAFVKDPEGFFELGASENYGDLSVQDFKRACEASVPRKGISEGALESIFCQLDRDKRGKISLEELTKVTEVARHFYKEAMVEDVILATLVRLSKRESNGEDLAHLSFDLVYDAVKDKVPEALAKRAEEIRDMLGRKEKADKKQKDQGIGKFATATYGEATAYDEGLSAIGTPHPNILEQMKKEATGGPDSTDAFTTWNSGEIHTSPLKEWDFVFDPFVPASVNKNTPLNKWIPKHNYGGNRAPIRLRVFLHATSATLMASGIRFGDYKKAHELPETDPQWLHTDEVDLVQVITLRFVKSQLDAVSLINAFSKKAALKGTHKFEWARMKVGRIVEALSEGLREKDGSASSCTYKFLVGKLTEKGIATEEEIEAILDHYHAKLAEANMSEAEVIGLREYSGPLYFKMNSSLRLVGVHVKTVVMLPCSLQICTQDFQQMFKAVVAAAAHVEPEVVSMDFVSELQTASTRIEVTVGVPPQQEGAEQVRTRLTELAINSELARYQEMASVLAAAVPAAPIGAGQPVFVEREVAELPTEKVSTKSESSGVQNWRYSQFINAVEENQVEKVTFSADGERVLAVDIHGNRFKLDGLTPHCTSLLDKLRKKKVDVTVLPDRISNISVVEAACVVGLSEHLKGNRYVNSIYACSSAMRKISHVSCIPKGRRVFRGMGGVKVPKKFVIEKEGGGRGGVDYAFMSTTTRKEVAVSYINEKEMPILFECEVDDLNRGCPLSFVSQFPAEDEVLIPAMSYIEMTGNPYVMETSKNSGAFVTVYPGRIHCNQKSQTIDEIEARRKHDICSMTFYIEQELLRDLTAVLEVLPKLLENQTEVMDQARTKALDDFGSLRKEWHTRDAKDFNNDSKYKDEMVKAIDFKVKKVIELGQLVYKADKLDPHNFLHVATRNGNAELSTILLSLGFPLHPADNVNYQDDMGETLMATACRVGNFEVFEKLLKAGADVNVVRCDGASALALAIVSDAGNARILNCMPKMIEYGESAEISYVRCLSLAFLAPTHIFRWLKDGRSARELLGVLCALMASAAAERPMQDRLSHVRAFINRHIDLLEDPSPLAPFTVTDVVEQLALQESDGVFDSDTAPQWTASIQRGVVWVNKPAVQHACRWTIQAGGPVRSVAYAADGSRLARTEGNDVVVCDAVSGFQVHRFKGHSADVMSVAFSTDGTVIASGSSDSTVRLWDVETGSCKCTLSGHSRDVNAVKWSPDGNSLASASDDETVRIWDASTGQCQSTLSGHSSYVLSVCFSPDGKQVASGNSDKIVNIWETSTGTCQSTLSGHSSPVVSVAWNNDGTKLATGSWDESVRIWSVDSTGTFECQSTLSGHSSLVLSVCFSPDGKQVASGSGDNTVKIWETSTGTCQSTLTGHSDSVWSVAWSPDGKQVASGSSDKRVNIWETSTDQSTLRRHSGPVTQVEFTHDGVTLVSGGTDGMRYWDVQSGEATSVLEGSMFAFSKASSREQKVGKFLITAEGDILYIFKNEGGVKDKVDKDTVPVAFFRAPSPIVTVDTSGVHIAVGCQNGEVLQLRVVVLSERRGAVDKEGEESD